jgi:hypothetical protein
MRERGMSGLKQEQIESIFSCISLIAASTSASRKGLVIRYLLGCADTEEVVRGDRCTTVHKECSWALRRNRRMYRIREGRSRREATPANLNLLRNCNGLWDLGSRGLVLYVGNNGYNRRMTRRCSCIKRSTGCQKYRDLWVFENPTNKVNRYVSNRNGQLICFRNCLRI